MAALALGTLGFSRALADQGWEGPSLHLTWENDATAGSDRHYTQGARILYYTGDDAVPSWFRAFSKWLPSVGFAEDTRKLGLQLGQDMYTPENLRAKQIIPDDRPYAGWLYGSIILERRGPGPAEIPVIEHLRLDLGVIGPESLAEQAQKEWHGRPPQGWDNQLDTEVAFVFRYDRSYLFRFPHWGNWAFDVIPSLDAAAGSIDVHLGLGALLRYGVNIPNRYEVPVGRTQKRWGIYCFGGADGRFVAHNIFLDGNTWQDSHSVDRDPFVARMTAGFSVVLGPIEILAAQNYLTHEFHGQRHNDSYGSATVVMKF